MSDITKRMIAARYVPSRQWEPLPVTEELPGDPPPLARAGLSIADRTKLLRTTFPALHSRPFSIPHTIARTNKSADHSFMVRELHLDRAPSWHVMSCDYTGAMLRWHGACPEYIDARLHVGRALKNADHEIEPGAPPPSWFAQVLL